MSFSPDPKIANWPMREFDQATKIRCTDRGAEKSACAVCKTTVCQSCYPSATHHRCSGIIYK
jgi:hypothetical protein